MRLLAEAVAEEMAEDGVVHEGMPRTLHFLAGENMHHGRHRLPRRLGVRSWTGSVDAGRGFMHGGDFGNADAGARQLRQPFGFQRLDHKQDGHANGNGLGKSQPEAAHNQNFSAG